MRAKTGIWLIGACGNVGMLTIVGARAIARGLAGTTGMVTELKELRELDLPRADDVVFGGHDRRPNCWQLSRRLVLSIAGIFDTTATAQQ